MCTQSLSHLWLFVTLWSEACQAPLSVGFPRQEYWNGLPFPTPGDRPSPGIEPASPSLTSRHFTTVPLRKLSLITKEIQIMTTMRCHLTPVRMDIIQKTTNNRCWPGCSEKEILMHCCCECKLVQQIQKTKWRFRKKIKNRTNIQSNNSKSVY